MWKDDRKRNTIRNIVIAVLWLALALALVKVFLDVSRKSTAEDAALVGTQAQQQEEQSAAKEQDISNILLEYDKDMATVQEYVPGIVCWGDLLTTGNTANVSYPDSLQQAIDENICDVYDFRLSMGDTQDYGKLDWNSFTVEIPVINMGGGEENAATILGRGGVLPYVTDADLAVPADTTPVKISFMSSDGSYVTPLKRGDNGNINPVTIGGIEGTISIDSKSYSAYYDPVYYFKRSVPGEEVVIPKGTEIKTDTDDEYTELIHVVFLGSYGSYRDVADIVEYAKQMVARQTKNSERFIVLGPCVYRDYWDQHVKYLDMLDTAMVHEFGSKYISIRKYLCEDGLAQVSSSNSDDAYLASRGIVPKCFRTTLDSVELNGTAYELIGKLIYSRMDKLGYFDEVKDELYIKETLKYLASSK